MTRVVLLLSAALSLFFFPYPATLVLSFLASLVFAPAAFLVGIAADLLYFIPGEGIRLLPAASLAGAALSAAALLVRRFLKARMLWQ